MRLSKIRIAGFKSFVDPVTLDLRSNLVGILGPNGCGKSNTIDAVRWVMGESSAKHLRGQSMDDVIFNGSSARKPVGVASVELVFDNSDGTLGGEYAQYAEISVKRQVSRDGTSKYFLNSARCRRRDITDIFLGTGLGPRSYAIIEQGMISRLIEAKPEELRNTLEEAAGISRYKDRRRETESRITHTRENLERLTDLREELEKQLQKLDRQAKAAIKFKELRGEEQRLEALSLLLQEQILQQESSELTQQLAKKSTEYQDQLSQVRTLESKVESLRQQHSEDNDKTNLIQGQYYQAGAEISRIEQTIKHQQDTRERQQNSLQQIQQALEETLRHAGEDRQTLTTSQQQLEELEPKSEALQQELMLAEDRLFDAEEQLSDWQEQWQELQQRIAEPTRQAQVEKTRMDQLEMQLSHQQQRLERLQRDAQNLSTSQFVEDVRAIELQLTETRNAYQLAEATLQEVSSQLQQQQQTLQQQQAELDNKRSRQQSQAGRLASLETLQQAGLDKDNKARQQWLNEYGLAKQPRLAEQLDVENGWETALETVLGGELDAVCVDSLPELIQEEWPRGGISLLETALETPSPQPLSLTGRGAIEGGTAENPLAHGRFAETVLRERGPGGEGAMPLQSKVKSPHTTRDWLQNIYCTDSLSTALQQRAQLHEGESLITPDGIWLGRHWIRIPRNRDAQGSILQRQKEIQQLQSRQQTLEQEVSALETSTSELRDTIRTLEGQRQQAQQESNRLHRDESALTSKLEGLQQRIDQLSKRQQQIQADQEEVQLQSETLRESFEQATEQRNIALEQLETLSTEREQLALEKDERQYAQDNARLEVRDYREQLHSLKLEIETQRNQLDNSRRQLERVSSRLELLEQQRDELLEQIAEEDTPQELLEAELEQALEQRAEVELLLTEARQALQQTDHDIRTQDGLRVEAERIADTLRDQQEQLKLNWQSVQVRLQTLTEQFADTEFEREPLLAGQGEDETLPNIQQRLENLRSSIQRLGAINLAAIDEFQEQSERKTWLDEQNADLVEALETLEAAIRKIDRETRARFKETFDQVNSRLKAMFPRLFGGGECYLEMTGDDLLTTGVAIMARPPGKRISSIHLMSGGEKALTAVALVFAIFELNPAPFCMLDEVDAPLDEANVGRFCDLVGHMAERVQFIFITHNKRTMELAENLIGVTMREPGVSRLVAVDVAEAVQLANINE
ncbi:MAG: chromosome segregation protein SMC [Thiolinea sp.]